MAGHILLGRHTPYDLKKGLPVGAEERAAVMPSADAAAAASSGVKTPSLPSVSLPSLPTLGGRSANDTTEVCFFACSDPSTCDHSVPECDM